MLAFLGRSTASRRGVWLFRGRPRRVDAALRRLGGSYETLRVSTELALVRSRWLGAPRELVRQALEVRTAWG